MSRKSVGRDTDSLYSLYSGGWDRPSVSEAVQEGVIGLTIAVDRFNPARGLRFSTYATYWISNSVRLCFQRASTGCLRVPVNYYDTKSRFKTLVKEYYESDGETPSMAVLAREMGLSETRLQRVLQLTQPLVSTDGPCMPRGVVTRPGKSGNVNSLQDNLLLSDTLVDDTELNPEDCVELSLLRQRLEHAMSVELAPFERDVLRLRLGLDDGVMRSRREVADECGGRLSAVDILSTEKRALKKLRSPIALSTYKLLTFLDIADVDRETVKMM
jgi:RNA polymerase sigma factor (sigma-70 family)